MRAAGFQKWKTEHCTRPKAVPTPRGRSPRRWRVDQHASNFRKVLDCACPLALSTLRNAAEPPRFMVPMRGCRTVGASHEPQKRRHPCRRIPAALCRDAATSPGFMVPRRATSSGVRALHERLKDHVQNFVAGATKFCIVTSGMRFMARLACCVLRRGFRGRFVPCAGRARHGRTR